jgi:hypothetical protein
VVDDVSKPARKNTNAWAAITFIVTSAKRHNISDVHSVIIFRLTNIIVVSINLSRACFKSFVVCLKYALLFSEENSK